MAGKNFKHFICAVKKSSVSMLVSVLLLTVIWALFDRGSGAEGQVIALCVGVASSVISTLIFRIGDKYEHSLRASREILDKVKVFVEEFGKIRVEEIHMQKHMNQMWDSYVKIARCSSALTYENDYNQLSEMLHKIINDMTDEKTSYEIIKKEVNSLEQKSREMTTC